MVSKHPNISGEWHPKKLRSVLSILIMELCIRKILFCPCKFQIRNSQGERKIFRMHISIMRIESVLGSFFGWHCPLMFGCLLTIQSNVHKFFLALERFLSHYSFKCRKSELSNYYRSQDIQKTSRCIIFSRRY